MSQSQTSGYDVLVQLSEQELNSQLANFTIPSITQPLTVNLTFERLELDVEPSYPQIDNCVRLRVVANAPSVNISSTIEIVTPLDVITIGNERVLVLQTAPPNQTFPYIVAVPSLAQPNPQPLPLFAANAIHNQLRTNGPISLGLSIGLGGGDPLKPTDMHVKVIDDPNASGIDCVTLMLNTGGSTGGFPQGITHYLGGSPTGAVVTLSNQLVIERLIRPNLASALGATFDPPCVLHAPVAISTGHWYVSYINLTTMTVLVEGDHLRVVGALERSKKGWSLSGFFDIRLYIVLNNGVLDIVQVNDAVSANFNFKPWVWIVSGLTGGLLGVIITAVIQFAINKAIDAALAKFSDLASKLGLNGVAVPTIPVGLNGGQLQLQSVLLDDLTLSGPVTLAPTAAAGIAMHGALHVSHTDTVTLANGVVVAGLHLIQQPGTHYVITRSRSFRGMFSAHLSQAAYPVTYAWTLDGAPMSGSGTVAITEPHGVMNELIDLFFQAEGAHCWIATPVGATLTGRVLKVTATDAAGHVSTASEPLSCVGVVVHDFVAGPMTLSANIAVLAHVGDGEVATPIDRKSELAAAFKTGLTAKPDKPPVVNPSRPPAKK